MIGIGIGIFGFFVALFGYVLIICNRSCERHCVNCADAKVTQIKPIGTTELNEAFYRVFVTYLVNKAQYTSSFVIHSSSTYKIGDSIDILFQPNHPNRIMSANKKTTILPFFIIITAFGMLLILIGIFLSVIGV